MRALKPDYVRSLVFGFEDSLVSTTGVIAGVSAGSHDPSVVVLAAAVTIVVEALSMGAGQFLSERAVHQMDGRHKDNLLVGAGFMFGSYALAGLVPLLPVILFPFPSSIIVSLAAALVGLFILGVLKGRIVGAAPVRSGLEMLIIGGVATVLGALAGYFFRVT